MRWIARLTRRTFVVPRHCALAALCLATLALAGHAPTSLAGAIDPADYEFAGEVERDPTTVVAFDVDFPDGIRRVRHVAFELPVACFDGSQHHQQGFVFSGYGVGRAGRPSGRFGSFGTRPWSNGDVGGDIALRGRLIDRDTARGYIEVVVDRFGPTPCYTGELRWRAKLTP
jgi:hypothetical protein